MKLLTPVCAFLAAAAMAADSDDIDLKRIDPVPKDQPIPIADFFRPALLSNPQVNEAGTTIAAIVTAGKDKHELMIYDIESKSLRLLGGVGDRDISKFTWLTDKRILYTLVADKKNGLGTMAVDIDHLRSAHPVLQYCSVDVVGIPLRNQGTPLVWIRSDGLNDGRDRGVAELTTSLDTGTLVNLYKAGADWSLLDATRENNDKHILKTYPVAPGGIGSSYMANREGELAFAYTAQDGVFSLHQWANGSWQKCPVDPDSIWVLGAGNKPGEVVVLGPRQEGKPRAVQFMDASTGELGQTLVQDAAYDFESGWLFRDRGSREIVGVMYERSGPHTIWFSEDYRTVQKAVEGIFPGQVVRLLQSDKKGRFLVATWSDRQPPAFHWVDLEKKSVGLIKKAAPWIDPERMQPMNVLKFKTRDGHQLEAFVTLPAGTSKKNPAPLIVLPHGGPWARDSWGFNPEAQFFANRGFAVLQPNYRGSLGYSWMFPYEDQFAFRKMHEDVTDAAKALLATGLIDKARVAIGGSSFGAYLAVSGVAHEPNMYRCAFAIAGVYDWSSVLRNLKDSQYYSPSFGLLKRRLGDPEKQRERFDEISPIRYVNQIRVPVFVAHGTDDPIADVSESKHLISEFEKNHVQYESLFVSGEVHGMAHLDNQVELYGRVEAFLKKYLAPTVPGAAKP